MIVAIVHAYKKDKRPSVAEVWKSSSFCFRTDQSIEASSLVAALRYWLIAGWLVGRVGLYSEKLQRLAVYSLPLKGSIMSSNYYYNKNNNKGKAEKKPVREGILDSKPGAVDVIPGASSPVSSRNSGNQVAVDAPGIGPVHGNARRNEVLDVSLRERREQQKRYKADASGAVASNAIGSASASAGAARPSFGDELRGSTPPQPSTVDEYGLPVATETAVASSLGPHQKYGRNVDAKLGAAMAGAVASSVKQQGGGPNYKDQMRASAPKWRIR